MSNEHSTNLGTFIAQAAQALGLPSTSAPEVVLRQCRITFDAAHKALGERDKAQQRCGDLQDALDAWAAIGCVTPGDWDGTAADWFRAFAAWVESGGHLEDWTDGDGEGTTIGTVAALMAERNRLKALLSVGRDGTK